MPRGREGASARAGWRPAERCERSSRPFSGPVGSPHPTTLQHHRRPNVTATVTRIVLWAEQGRHSGIHATTVKRCMLAFLKMVADFPRGSALPMIARTFLLTHPLTIREGFHASAQHPVTLGS